MTLGACWIFFDGILEASLWRLLLLACHHISPPTGGGFDLHHDGLVVAADRDTVMTLVIEAH